MKFEEKLLELRKEKNMSQEDLANELIVSRQSISKWEIGTSMPDIQNLIRLSELFDVSLDYLLKDHVARKTDNFYGPPDDWEGESVVGKMSFVGGALGVAAAIVFAKLSFVFVGGLVGFAIGGILNILKIVK